MNLTWSNIPMKAQNLNIFRGTLTRYCRGEDRAEILGLLIRIKVNWKLFFYVS